MSSSETEPAGPDDFPKGDCPGLHHRKDTRPGRQGRFLFFWSAHRTPAGREAIAKGWAGNQSEELIGTGDEIVRQCRALHQQMMAWLERKPSKKRLAAVPALLPVQPLPKKTRRGKKNYWYPGQDGAETESPGKTRVKRSKEIVYFWSAWKTIAGKKAIAEGWTGQRQVRLLGTHEAMDERCRELQAEIIAWLYKRTHRTAGQELALSPQQQELNFFLGHRPSRHRRALLSPTIDKTPYRELVEANGADGQHFDGTIGSLVLLYRFAEESPFHKLKYTSKESRERELKRLMVEHGARRVASLTRKFFFQTHQELLNNTSVSTALKVMDTFRTILRFGVGLNRRGFPDECQRAAEILRTMRFEKTGGRSEYLTADMVKAIRTMAHKMGAPSVALAQAIQFETALRQKDVIGEWWPGLDGGPKTRETWTSGLVWSQHISLESLVMVKPTSKSKFRKKVIADLSQCPMFMEEFRKMAGRDLSGPVIVNEQTGVPYRGNTFSQKWRRIANAAGLPHTHWNMDSRAGAVTEGSEAEIDIEHLRQFATHSDAATTRHYNRETLKKARSVHRKRAEHRDGARGNDFTHGPIIDHEAS